MKHIVASKRICALKLIKSNALPQQLTTTTVTTTRDYIWLPSNDNHNDTYTEDVLAANDNAAIDLPLAVAEAATLYTIHTDHLGRPLRMTNATKSTVWQAVYKPWGEVQSISGTTTNNLRFPGQYFQIETGMHYNWHRNYDPVTGRYTQPDPLGFVDGPSVYAYVGNSPFMNVDREGREWIPPFGPLPGLYVPDGTVGGVWKRLGGSSSPAVCTPNGINIPPNLMSTPVDNEHTKNARPSTKGKHEKGQGRKIKDQGGEKADERRRPPLQRPNEWKGKWPPT